MIALLLLVHVAVSAASSDPVLTNDMMTGHWSVLSDNGTPCIMMNAQIDLTLSYIRDDDSLVEAATFSVPVDSTTDGSSCSELMQIDSQTVDSQVLQLNFPENDGWNVRLAFTQEDKRLDVDPGDYALYRVIITANYSSMPDIFVNTLQGHTHTYYSTVTFTEPPEISDVEYTRVGDCIFCPDRQEFIINADPHKGPPAVIHLSNLQMQAYMTNEDFGKKTTCSDDQTELDLIPVVCSAVLAGLVLFTLFAYFVYRARLPADILNMVEQEFAEEEDEEDHTHKTHNHHDNSGYQEENGHI